MSRWRGLRGLVHDAIDGTTELVREGHASVHRTLNRVSPQASAVQGVGRVVQAGTAGTLASVTAVNRVVQAVTDLALEHGLPDAPLAEAIPIPLRSDVLRTAAWIEDAALGSLNGAVGHHLTKTHNPLDLGLQLRLGDRYLDPGQTVDAVGTVVVWVHGLGTTEWCWALDAEAYHGDPSHTFGSMLHRDLGHTPLFTRYNTGRRISDSGRALAEALEAALASEAVTRVVLVGHSMGGLVARAACRAAQEHDHRWLAKVDGVMSLGSPHRGAPLARFGQSVTVGLGAIDLPTTRIISRLLSARSAGIRDLEHGDLSDLAQDPDATAAPADRAVPLVEGIRYAFLSATVTSDPDDPLSTWLGDLFVQVSSASGPGDAQAHSARTATFPAIKHHQLQCHPAVYREVRRWISQSNALDVPC